MRDEYTAASPYAPGEAEIALLEGSVLSECHAVEYDGGLQLQPVTRSQRRLTIQLGVWATS